MKYKTAVITMFLLVFFFIGYLIVLTVQAFNEQNENNNKANITFSDEIDIPQPPEAGSSATTQLYFTVLPAD